MKYKITDIRQRTKEVEGERVPFMRVFYKTETGFEGSVDIDKGELMEKEARKQIEKEIRQMVKLGKEKEVSV